MEQRYSAASVAGPSLVTMNQMQCLCAYEASVLEAHLTYKSFPKSRRRFAEAQVKRLRALARGEYPHDAYGFSYQSLNAAMRDARNDGSMAPCGHSDDDPLDPAASPGELSHPDAERLEDGAAPSTRSDGQADG